MRNFAGYRRESFGRLLSLAIEVGGWTPNTLGPALGLTGQAIRNWRDHKRVPSRDVLVAIEAKVPGITRGRLVSILYEDVPVPNRTDSLEAIQAFGLGAAEVKALESVVLVFMADRPPVPVPPRDPAVADMTANESIQEDPCLTWDEKVRLLGLVDLFLRNREGPDVVVTP